MYIFGVNSSKHKNLINVQFSYKYNKYFLSNPARKVAKYSFEKIAFKVKIVVLMTTIYTCLQFVI